VPQDLLAHKAPREFKDRLVNKDYRVVLVLLVQLVLPDLRVHPDQQELLVRRVRRDHPVLLV
jgi:hypothetical protein